MKTRRTKRPCHTRKHRLMIRVQAVSAALALLVLVPTAIAHGQSAERDALRQAPTIAGAPVLDQIERLQLATVTTGYPVTPGDVYRLSYRRNGEPVSMELVVDNDYSINLSLFGRLDATGTTFAQIKPRIERLVENAIPRSLPVVTLESVGVFQVRIAGQIAQSRVLTAWGMTRLSDVVRDHLAPYSSVRSITIVGEDRSERSYDLFRALEAGDESQDPYVKPGDTVRIGRAERVVYVGGEVNEPGRVELLPQETFDDALRYVRGLDRNADLTRTRVTRSEDRSIRTHFVNLTDPATELVLYDGDVVIIPMRRSHQTVVYVEERLPLPYLAEAVPGFPEPSRRVVPIGSGETLHGVLQQVRGELSPQADLSQGFLVRDGRRVTVPVSFERLLYSWEEELDVTLEPFDRIVVPYQSFLAEDDENDVFPSPDAPIDPDSLLPDGLVTTEMMDAALAELLDSVYPAVPIGLDEPYEHEEEPIVLITGAVNAPGRYPLLPGRNAYTHIRRAGGFNREMNVNEAFRVFDAGGNVKPNDAPIEAGDHIEVMRNSFVYNYNRYFPVVATGVGFLATIVATISLFGL